MNRSILILLLVLFVLLQTVLSFNMKVTTLPSRLKKGIMKKDIIRSYRNEQPKMVVYWSIKSSFDLVRYAVGQTDKFVGTGVWSFIKFDKKKSLEEEDEVLMIDNKKDQVKDLKK